MVEMSNERRSVEIVKQMQEHERSRLYNDLSKRVLASVNKPFVGEQTMAWLKNVNENVPVKPGATDQPDAKAPALTMVTIVDKLFDDFQRYAYQFNQNEPNRDYLITCRRPTADDYRKATTSYQGNLQNSTWAMLVSGEPKAIKATLVPPRFLYDDESHRPALMPLLQIYSDVQAGGPVWKIDGHPVIASHLSTISKMVFARLVRVTRGEVSESDKLTFTPEKSASSDADQPTWAGGSPTDIATNALIALLDAVDNELEDLRKVGVETLKSEGMDGLAAIMKKAEALKLFRQNAGNLANDWKTILEKGAGS
jgi:hypothetical protein